MSVWWASRQCLLSTFEIRFENAHSVQKCRIWNTANAILQQLNTSCWCGVCPTSWSSLVRVTTPARDSKLLAPQWTEALPKRIKSHKCTQIRDTMRINSTTICTVLTLAVNFNFKSAAREALRGAGREWWGNGVCVWVWSARRRNGNNVSVRWNQEWCSWFLIDFWTWIPVWCCAIGANIPVVLRSKKRHTDLHNRRRCVHAARIERHPSFGLHLDFPHI